MTKQVIFNVGGALSSYLEFDDNRVVIDLGKSADFNPVEDFLLPLAQKKFGRDTDTGKYQLTQAFISHLDDDHISAITEFDKHFRPEFLTAPCNHPKQNRAFNVTLKLLGKDNPNRTKVLAMMKSRSPGYGRLIDQHTKEPIEEDKNKPLVVHKDCLGGIELYHLRSADCTDENKLDTSKYSNNLSLVLYLNLNGHTILIPGDIMSDGLSYLLKSEEQLRHNLQATGVDFLIAPHHGLTTSFPNCLFQVLKHGKTNRLYIISEKVRESDSDENRSEVDSRYYSSDFCRGNNNLGLYGTKTSIGHLVIDYASKTPTIRVIETDRKDQLISEFL